VICIDLKCWIRIRIDLNCWIRIRIKANADPHNTAERCRTDNTLTSVPNDANPVGYRTLLAWHSSFSISVENTVDILTINVPVINFFVLSLFIVFDSFDKFWNLIYAENAYSILTEICENMKARSFLNSSSNSWYMTG
jgi:hypothetical protein